MQGHCTDILQTSMQISLIPNLISILSSGIRLIDSNTDRIYALSGYSLFRNNSLASGKRNSHVPSNSIPFKLPMLYKWKRHRNNCPQSRNPFRCNYCSPSQTTTQSQLWKLWNTILFVLVFFCFFFFFWGGGGGGGRLLRLITGAQLITSTLIYHGQNLQ